MYAVQQLCNSEQQGIGRLREPCQGIGGYCLLARMLRHDRILTAHLKL